MGFGQQKFGSALMGAQVCEGFPPFSVFESRAGQCVAMHAGSPAGCLIGSVLGHSASFYANHL